MRITIKFKDKTEVTIFNVYSVEKIDFELCVKQLNQKFTYSLNKFDIDKISEVRLCMK